jgi:hypothetical protein
VEELDIAYDSISEKNYKEAEVYLYKYSDDFKHLFCVTQTDILVTSCNVNFM